MRLHCERRHAGLKSAKPCSTPSDLDLPTLIAVFGVYLTADELKQRVMCPRCGSRQVRLQWHEGPKQPSAPRQMQPIEVGQVVLADYQGDLVVIACAGCRRRGQYRVETLLAAFGPDALLTDLHRVIAAARGCSMASEQPERCRVRYEAEQPKVRNLRVVDGGKG